MRDWQLLIVLLAGAVIALFVLIVVLDWDAVRPWIHRTPRPWR